VFALIALSWTRDLWVSSSQVQPVAYSEFVQHLKEGRVASVSVVSKVLEGKLKAQFPGRNAVMAAADGGAVRVVGMTRADGVQKPGPPFRSR
jgi:hypothetical protein